MSFQIQNGDFIRIYQKHFHKSLFYGFVSLFNFIQTLTFITISEPPCPSLSKNDIPGNLRKKKPTKREQLK